MLKLEIFDAILNNGTELNEASFKIMEADQDSKPKDEDDAPKDDAPVGDDELTGVGKEFLGSREGIYYYLVDQEGDDTDSADVVVQDQEETVVYSAKEHDLDVDDKLGVIIAAAQDLGMEYLTYSMFQKYALPVIKGEEEFEEDLEPEDMIADDSAPEVPEEAEEALGEMPPAPGDEDKPKDDDEEEDDKKIKDSVKVTLSGKEYVLEHIIDGDKKSLFKLNGKMLGLSEANVGILTKGSTAENKLETLANSLASLYEKKVDEGICPKCNRHMTDCDCDYDAAEKDKEKEKAADDDMDEGINPDPTDKEEVKIKKLQEDDDDMDEGINPDPTDKEEVKISSTKRITHLARLRKKQRSMTRSPVFLECLRRWKSRSRLASRIRS